MTLNTSGHSLLIVRKILSHERVTHGPLATNWMTYGSQTRQNPLRSNSLAPVLKAFCYVEPKHGPLTKSWKNAMMAHTPDYLCGLKISPGRTIQQSPKFTENFLLSPKPWPKEETRFAGHCFRAKDQVITDLLWWRLPCPRRGNRPLTYQTPWPGTRALY